MAPIDAVVSVLGVFDRHASWKRITVPGVNTGIATDVLPLASDPDETTLNAPIEREPVGVFRM